MNGILPLLRRLVPASLFARLTLILLAGLAAAQLLTTTLTIDERNDVTMGSMIDSVETDLRTAVALLDRLPPGERAAWPVAATASSWRRPKPGRRSARRIHADCWTP